MQEEIDGEMANNIIAKQKHGGKITGKGITTAVTRGRTVEGKTKMNRKCVPKIKITFKYILYGKAGYYTACAKLRFLLGKSWAKLNQWCVWVFKIVKDTREAQLVQSWGKGLHASSMFS